MSTPPSVPSDDVAGVAERLRSASSRMKASGWIENLRPDDIDNAASLILSQSQEIERLRSIRNDTIEECAKVAETSVRQECCGNSDIIYDASPVTGDPIPVGEECCGNPDVVPMRPEEIASSIRSLKDSPNA